MNYYLQVQQQHFDACEKCEILENEVSKMVETSNNDKKIGKIYKNTEGIYSLELTSKGKLTKALKEKSTTLEIYINTHVNLYKLINFLKENFNNDQIQYVTQFNYMKQHNENRQMEIFKIFKSCIMNFQQSQLENFNIKGNEEALESLKSELNPSNFSAYRNLRANPEKFVDFICYKYFSFILEKK